MTLVNVTNNSPSRDYSYPDDQTTQPTETPGFKPFTILQLKCLQLLQAPDFIGVFRAVSIDSGVHAKHK